MSETKFCRDCKSYNDVYPEDCRSPHRPAKDFVSGKEAPLLPAFTARMNHDLCGLEAKWFEAKALDPGEGWSLKTGEIIQPGDECWCPDSQTWNSEVSVGRKMYPGLIYRRRIEPELERCPEGHEVVVNEHCTVPPVWRVVCRDNTCWWRGTHKLTKEEATSSWNSVMRAYRKSNECPTALNAM